jgi:SAM-dependent methyltransferase
MHNSRKFGLQGILLANRDSIAFPVELFDRLAKLGVGLPGQTVLDLGTGKGGFARVFAERGCEVVGIDRSPDMLSEAEDAGDAVSWRCARAENTGEPDGIYDAVVAGQAWHWFDQRRTAQEARRVLKHDGLIAIAQMDWVPRAGGAAEATEEIIQHYNSDWNILFRQSDYMAWSRQLGMTGFGDIQEATFNVEVEVEPAVWRRRIRASAGVGGVLPRGMADALDRDLEARLAEEFPGPMLHILHKVFYLVASA